MIRLFNRAATEFLIIEETREGFFLYSFPKVGIEGDTWHPSLEEAKEQASYAFCAAQATWVPVSPEITNLPDFGRENSN